MSNLVGIEFASFPMNKGKVVKLRSIVTIALKRADVKARYSAKGNGYNFMASMTDEQLEQVSNHIHVIASAEFGMRRVGEFDYELNYNVAIVTL